jgi:hypothetical protein
MYVYIYIYICICIYIYISRGLSSNAPTPRMKNIDNLCVSYTTPLHEAAAGGSIQCVRLLLRYIYEYVYIYIHLYIYAYVYYVCMNCIQICV